MGILFGFAPWIVYWVLVGNVPFVAAVLVALAVAVASLVIGRIRGAAGRTLEIGAVATFLILAVLTFTLSQSFMEQWLQPLSTAGIFLVALGSVLVGKPFVREFAEVGQPKEVIESDLFKKITNVLTWIWVAAFGGMTVSSAIPPIVYGEATILDTRTPLSFVCYWVIPFSLLGLAALASRILPERMAPPEDEIVRKTTFVAFAEAEIDQLMYLATEHANREVGAGKEAYDIRIGSKGVPLVGDETRESWPSTYKVRDKKR
ncbi:hypothetical protein BST36_22505 [Mycolicibacterium moriokaense]|uniref:Intracellular septation protein A n=1 Tax=Mycolicibacterium moriokaense TaxID=39691 RepID=A0AAD1HED9_9MYCO|nr:hypothetical protein [Mycolicibacterium moriokaense]MCV7038101.1 hypothetical protein [Mycolicibacterium moriokaense]ORB19231.1 hypothetical protein BST36_22505 [Mycolicibacterium moriokaense]BBX03069.1 hypothetical protein MMOR_40050 [Mycolicibacterium moriokaense]